MATTDATIPQASTPVTNEAIVTPNTPPAVGDLDLSLDLPPVAKEESIPDTDWLKEEDKIVQKEAPVEVKQAEIIQENLPISSDKNLLQSSLQDDMKIIQNIENTATITPQPVERILEAKKPDPTAEANAFNVQLPTPEVIQIQAPTMNLDSLLGNPAPVAAPIEQAKNPFDLIQANTPAQQVAQPAVITAPVAAPLASANKNKTVKIGLFVVLFVALGFFTYFIISTMYPMGFSNNGTGAEIVAITTGNDLTGNNLTGDSLTGDILSGTEIVATDSTGTVDTGHGSATDDSNFQDLNNLMNDSGSTTTALSQDAIVAQLNNYQQLGISYLVPSKAQNDLQGMKYALYLKNKSQTVLNEIIANPDAMSTMQSDLTTQLAQFETFLQQLKTKYGDLTTTSGTQTQTTPTDQIFNSLTQE